MRFGVVQVGILTLWVFRKIFYVLGLACSFNCPAQIVSLFQVELWQPPLPSQVVCYRTLSSNHRNL